MSLTRLTHSCEIAFYDPMLENLLSCPKREVVLNFQIFRFFFKWDQKSVRRSTQNDGISKSVCSKRLCHLKMTPFWAFCCCASFCNVWKERRALQLGEIIWWAAPGLLLPAPAPASATSPSIKTLGEVVKSIQFFSQLKNESSTF